jgi:hypothetical protein
VVTGESAASRNSNASLSSTESTGGKCWCPSGVWGLIGGEGNWKNQLNCHCVCLGLYVVSVYRWGSYVVSVYCWGSYVVSVYCRGSSRSLCIVGPHGDQCVSLGLIHGQCVSSELIAVIFIVRVHNGQCISLGPIRDQCISSGLIRSHCVSSGLIAVILYRWGSWRSVCTFGAHSGQCISLGS